MSHLQISHMWQWICGSHTQKRDLRQLSCLKWSEVAQSCPTLCNPMDCSLSGSAIHGIFQARVLEWIAISFSRGSSRPRKRTQVSHIAGRHFTVWGTREAPNTQYLTIIIYGMFASFQWALQNIFCFMVNMRVSLTRMSTVQGLYVLFLLR